MLKRFISIPVMALALQVGAQDSLVVTPLTGAAVALAVDSITRVRFTDSTVSLGGVGGEYSITSLRKLTFKDGPAVSRVPRVRPAVPHPAVSFRRTDAGISVTVVGTRSPVVSASLFSMDGRVVKRIRRYIGCQGMGVVDIPIPSMVRNGVYILLVSDGSEVQYRHTLHNIK